MRSRHQCLLALRYAAIYSRALSFYLVSYFRVLLRGFLRRVRLNDLLPMSDCRMFPSICALTFLVARRSLAPRMVSPCRCDRSCRPVAPVMRNTTKLPELSSPNYWGVTLLPPSQASSRCKLSDLDVVLLPYILPFGVPVS